MARLAVVLKYWKHIFVEGRCRRGCGALVKSYTKDSKECRNTQGAN